MKIEVDKFNMEVFSTISLQSKGWVKVLEHQNNFISSFITVDSDSEGI